MLGGKASNGGTGAERRDLLAEPDRFAAALCAWFEREGLDYPWRRTRDAYRVLVSEVMLQQTQVATVLGRGYYERWLDRFPDAATLADAAEDEVLKSWEGLGYYRRARNLQKAARAVVERFGGEFPEEPERLMELPGVGRYTAGAVASFAFDAPAPLVDGNVARVLSRLFDFRLPVDGTAGQNQLWEWAAALVPPGGGRVFNSALMELGQRVCTPGSPGCDGCPVAPWCRADDPSSLPLKSPRARTVERDEHAVWVRRRGGDVLLARETGSRRRGLWRLPERSGPDVAGLPVLYQSRYSITRYRVHLTVADATGSAAGNPRDGESWTPVGRLDELAFASPYRKALESLA